MSLQLLEDKRVGVLNDEQEQLSNSIKENADRLLGITGELLNMTQVEAGKLQMMPKITKPIELIEYADVYKRQVLMFGAAFTRREPVFSPLWVLGSVIFL